MRNLTVLIIIVALFACTSNSYRLVDEPRGELKPQYSEQDVALQEELVEGWRMKCIKSKKNNIFCDSYKREHGYLQNFYYLPQPVQKENPPEGSPIID